MLDRRRTSGYDALAQGVMWQSRIAEEWQAEGFPVQLGWGHDQPDIVLGPPHGLPPVIVSVKTYNLRPSSMCYGDDGRHSFASARTITRQDVVAEIDYAIAHRAYMVILTVVNQRNGIAEHIELDPATFTRYATSQSLNDDSAPRAYIVRDLHSLEVLEVNEKLGWKRIAGSISSRTEDKEPLKPIVTPSALTPFSGSRGMGDSVIEAQAAAVQRAAQVSLGAGAGGNDQIKIEDKTVEPINDNSKPMVTTTTTTRVRSKTRESWFARMARVREQRRQE